MMARLLAARLVIALLALGNVLVGGAACGGDDDGTPSFPDVVSLGGDREMFPSIANTALAVGENRVIMTLIDRDDARVLDAEVHVAYYALSGDKPRYLAESDARFVSAELAFVDDQSGMTTPVGEDGVYVTYVTFDEPGDWGADIRVSRRGEEIERVPFRFTVLERAPDLAIGDAAPASVQATLDDNASIEDIDSSSPPRPQMHDVTVAEALQSGEPLVVAFATPAFCSSRTCAPVMDTVMDPLYEKYGERATFIHIEPYVLAELRSANVETPVGATREWRLHGEPWVFVVDRGGRITGKFEGIMAADEVEAVLVRALEATAQ